MRYLDSGAPPGRVTVSSDAGGCLPCFDADGHVTHMDVGDAGALLHALRELVARGVPLERALPAFTSNPARLLRLARKGRIEVGADADLVALDETGAARDVIVSGVVHVRAGRLERRGTFEAAWTSSATATHAAVTLHANRAAAPRHSSGDALCQQGPRRSRARLDHPDRRRRGKRTRPRASCARFVDAVRRRRRRHRGDPDRQPAAPTPARATSTSSPNSAPAASPRSISIPVATPAERNRLERIEQATGIFFTGGNQLRLSTMLGGTPVAQADPRAQRARRARRRHQRRRQHPAAST